MSWSPQKNCIDSQSFIIFGVGVYLSKSWIFLPSTGHFWGQQSLCEQKWWGLWCLSSFVAHLGPCHKPHWSCGVWDWVCGISDRDLGVNGGGTWRQWWACVESVMNVHRFSSKGSVYESGSGAEGWVIERLQNQKSVSPELAKGSLKAISRNIWHVESILSVGQVMFRQGAWSLEAQGYKVLC